MYTRGRERELAALGAVADAVNDPRARLVSLVHDWLDGKCGVESVITGIPRLVDEHASVTTCNVAFHWVNRLIAADERFLDCYFSLCGSRLSLMRIHAAFNYEFGCEGPPLPVFNAFLRDKSSKIREQIVASTSMGRWVGAVSFLRLRQSIESKSEIRSQIAEAIELIEEGFRVDKGESDRCWVYSGNGPGGAGAVSFVRMEDYPIEISFHVRDVEQRYFQSHGVYPKRPKGYEYRPNILLQWDPNECE